jgi:hypothetical protein
MIFSYELPEFLEGSLLYMSRKVNSLSSDEKLLSPKAKRRGHSSHIFTTKAVELQIKQETNHGKRRALL